jgi:hypothetical protein
MSEPRPASSSSSTSANYRGFCSSFLISRNAGLNSTLRDGFRTASFRWGGPSSLHRPPGLAKRFRPWRRRRISHSARRSCRNETCLLSLMALLGVNSRTGGQVRTAPRAIAAVYFSCRATRTGPPTSLEARSLPRYLDQLIYLLFKGAKIERFSWFRKSQNIGAQFNWE